MNRRIRLLPVVRGASIIRCGSERRTNGDNAAGEPSVSLEHIIDTPAGTLRVRPAVDADDPGLRRLFSSITMDADLSLRVDREPDVFALYRMQHAHACEAWIGELDGEVVGLGTLMARDGYVGGELRRIGYLGDLRLDPRVRGREVLATIYGPVLDGFAERHGVGVFYTAVIASNRRAVAALTGPKAASLGIPAYHLLQRFASARSRPSPPAAHRAPRADAGSCPTPPTPTSPRSPRCSIATRALARSASRWT